MKSRSIPTISDLFDPCNFDLSYPELLEKCENIDLTISESQVELIEQDTREQAKGNAFFRHRAGRIGASLSWAVAHTNPAMPSQSLIKSISYPDLFKVTTKAISHGRKNESAAVNAYTKTMLETHRDLKVEQCGMIVDKQHPWINATPDFLVSCSCCGNGCGEVKCPYNIENCDLESYVEKKNSCLENVNGKVQLKRNHQYFFQVQQQLFITDSQYCDFVVCSFDNNNQTRFFLERIYKDISHWESVLPKLTKVWRSCILPEILGRWYTRKHEIAAPVPAGDIKPVCYCRKPKPEESTVPCQNPKCPFIEFHLSCLGISDPLPKVWYCPSCQLLPECKKAKRVTKIKPDYQKNPDFDEAMKLQSICVCKAKPVVGEKLLKCHSQCQSGKFFHLKCLNYKRMPNNSKLYWVCKNCKVKKKPADKSSLTIPTTCSSYTTSTTCTVNNPSASVVSGTEYESDKDIEIPCVTESRTASESFEDLHENESNKYCTGDEYESDEDLEIICVTKGVANRIASFGDLDEHDYDIISSPDGWLDCKIIQAAQICIKKVNPLIEGFQRPTLGRVRNFDIMTSDFVQILHTGNSHWVCISSIGCTSGCVNLYDSLYNDIIDDEVEQQVKDLLPDNFVGIEVVPVQQQMNGSDCGIFAVAFATCLVFELNPSDFMFDIPRMRPHLLECLRAGEIKVFPHF